MSGEYHKNLMRHSLAILNAGPLLPNNRKSTLDKDVVESKSVIPNKKEEQLPQYFYDISTNLFVPPSL